MNELVFYNGKFVDYEDVRIKIDDRGYNFADGVYEVVCSYNGKPFKMEEHFLRLKFSASEIDINIPDYKELMSYAYELIKRSHYDNLKLYIQITRGTQKRSHAYKDNLAPNIIMTVRELKGYPNSYFEDGVKAITVPDERWTRCYIKTISLLPNILAKKKAKKKGVFEAIQIRDGFLTEGTSSNVFIVMNGKIVTPPATNYILNGITRRVIIDEAPKIGYDVEEKSISVTELLAADEVFLTGTTSEVMPLVTIDRVQISDKSGTITTKLFKHYREITGIK